MILKRILSCSSCELIGGTRRNVFAVRLTEVVCIRLYEQYRRVYRPTKCYLDRQVCYGVGLRQVQLFPQFEQDLRGPIGKT